MPTITVKKNVVYSPQKGIVLGDDFLDKDRFIQVFKDMLQDTDTYIYFRQEIAQAKRIISIIQKGNRIRSITEFTSDLETISQLFSKFMRGLGGNISLLTTFNFGSSSSETYFLMNEDDLPSNLNEIGEKTYLNTLNSLQQVRTGANNLQKLNDALQSHLDGFTQQLNDSNLQSQQDYINMKTWAYKNMRRRYKAIEAEKNLSSVSISYYFWGRGQTHGFISEAFGTHIALMHPNALTQNHLLKLSKSVISEHGGPGSVDLFTLLKESKGNTSSQLSGDIVVVDAKGKVQFNIQSKASTNAAYSFTITYQKFLQNMMLFLDTYDKYASNPQKLQEKDADALFNAFATTAWVPVSQKVAKYAEKEKNDLMLSVGIT